MSQRAERRRAGAPPATVPPWAHEDASHRIVLAGVAVAYQLQRSGRRRTIGFSIDTDGLAVRAPRRSRQADIDAALRGKAAWILGKLAAAADRRQQLQARRTRWQHGTRLPYLGGELLLDVRVAGQAGRVQARLQAASAAGASDGASLQLCVPPATDAQGLADATERWMKAQARTRFQRRLQHFAPMLDVRWQRLRLSSARTRWGSASTRGTISLHWRLMQMAPEVIDYVVVHELAHLREMNHGPRFWAHVATVLPDYASRRAALKAADLPPWS